ncbi:hypothetical protein GHK92_05460 [Nocardioides sp. dk4132]|uniref:hypothetical protein n=1 Tax=unclassified Nocardioides TaxID=2615069 RepID=UPI001296AD8B|nr:MULTISPECIES: hypothetical protein [unclassified Nocardioides]MQW75315.1 hypothetical protein [Nocardioides sp. dk4132]QGA07536.1 hypothetical protein GFH29_09150 [Nocardioides sp. dk884]
MPRSPASLRLLAVLVAGLVASLVVAAAPAGAAPVSDSRASDTTYPWHTRIVATTFWVGEIFDPDAPDGSQMISTYDDNWYANYGGCDGQIRRGVCRTERRFKRDGWFPRHMTPKQNPFYLDLPYDDLNDKIGFRRRGEVIPWASRPRYAGLVGDRDVSLMKNRWVQIRSRGRTCYGQIQDAGPGKYHDARYVFGHRDARPASKRYNNAGMDVSPALNGCLRFRSLNGKRDRVDWRFVDARDVPRGPWKRIVTR